MIELNSPKLFFLLGFIGKTKGGRKNSSEI